MIPTPEQNEQYKNLKATPQAEGDKLKEIIVKENPVTEPKLVDGEVLNEDEFFIRCNPVNISTRIYSASELQKAIQKTPE